MDTTRICPNCGKALPPDVPLGLCPECLIKAGFPSGTEGAAGAGFVPPPVEEIARLFPQLEILGLLGKGGMGAVYKARQPALDRLVALKVLPPTVANDPGFAERFNREARALARLSHPNIVAVHDFGQAGPLHYLLMELVDGTNLRELEQAGRLSPQQALAIVPQICEALQFAHNEGIVHRDIKPENLLLDKKGRVKITDFGIAKILGAPAGKVSLTGVKDVVGTPHYMAPEQIEQPQAVDHRADIYSLGVVFYEMLTGELPLGKFQPPSQKVQMDVRLDEVVLRTLEKEPARRYQQVSEVKTRVETIASTPLQAALPNVAVAPVQPMSDKTILPAFLLAFFFGVFGAHRFYAGKIRTAFLQLGVLVAWIPLIVAIATSRGDWEPGLGLLLAAFVVGSGIWATIDWILLLCKAFTDGQGRRITNWVHPGAGGSRPAPLPQGAPPPNPAVTSGKTSGDNRGMIIAPAVGLMVAGSLKAFTGLKILLLLSGPASGLVNSILSALGINYSVHLSALLVVSTVLFTLVPAAVTLFGAIEMIQIRNYGWAVAAAILSILGCGLIGVPVGIWALIVLLLADVRQIFANPPRPLSPSTVKWPWVLAAAAMVSLLLVLTLSLFGPSPKTAEVPSNRLQRFAFWPDMEQIIGLAVKAAGDSRETSQETVDTNDSGNAIAKTNSGSNPANDLSPQAIAAGAATFFSKSIAVGPDGKLTIKADRGDIQIAASDESTLQVQVKREVTRASDARAATILKEEHLVLKRNGNEISITAVDPSSLHDGSWWNRPNLEVHYEITLPRKFAVHLETMGGDIKVVGVQGNVFAKTAGGELEFDDIAGLVDGQTMGGSITIEKFAGPNIRVKTMGGSISADFASAPQSACELHTMGGGVTVRIPGQAAVRLDAYTMGGTVRSDLPVQVEGQLHDNSLQGTINGGGPLLKLETLGGNIEVLRHE
jgi:serine/threonine protein kinase